MHNIAEGCDAGTDLEFARFLKIARRSCSEVQSELYLAADRDYATETETKQAYELADEVKRVINGLIGYLRSADRIPRRSTPQVRELPTLYSTTDHETKD